MDGGRSVTAAARHYGADRFRGDITAAIRVEPLLTFISFELNHGSFSRHCYSNLQLIPVCVVYGRCRPQNHDLGV